METVLIQTSKPYIFMILLIRPINGPHREKTCLRGFAINTGADQPAHPRSLISAFVIRFLDSFICKHATGEISIFYIVSVAEETGLNLALTETLKTGFLRVEAQITLTRKSTVVCLGIPHLFTS